MAKGYIERDIALKLIKEEGINQAEQYADRHHPVVMAYGDCFGKIKSLPTADVEEVKHGMWIDDGDCFHCSVCNKTYQLGSLQTIYDVKRCWQYCANCGAKMDGNTKDMDKTRCNKCVNEMHCSRHRVDCPDYKRDASDGGYYG